MAKFKYKLGFFAISLLMLLGVLFLVWIIIHFQNNTVLWRY